MSPCLLVLRKVIIYVCFFLLGFFTLSLAVTDTPGKPKKELCRPMSCGVNGPNITYPFWIEGRHPSYCGIPAFALGCDQRNATVLAISGANYSISEVYYGNRTLWVTEDLVHGGDNCQYPYRNVTIDRTPFGIAPAYSNSSLYFFVNCRRNSSVPGYFQVPCSGTNLYVGDTLTPNQTDSLRSCDYHVVAPIAKSTGVDATNYKEVLARGFVLSWTAEDCDRCLQSGGSCEYDNVTDGIMCICSDRVHLFECHASKQLSVKLKIIISVVSIFVGCILAFACFFLWKRHKKNKEISSLNKLSISPSRTASMQGGVEVLTNHYRTHIFSYSELEEATDGFASYNELGDGGFGVVYKGKLRDGRVVAVKRLYQNSYKRVEQFVNEVSILNLLRHRNLVTLYGCTSRHSRGLLLVYEYISNGTVADHLHGSRAAEGALTWSIRLNIAIETAGALAYLHAVEPPVIHRDVKTNNILLDDNFHVKVADFGLSRLFPPDVSHVSTVPQGTPGYVDPEYYQCYKLTDKSDVFSFGVVLIELISSKPAVDVSRHRHEVNLSSMAISKIQNSRLHELVDTTFGYNSDWKARKMIETVAEVALRCLQPEKEIRPSMEEVLEFLKMIPDQIYEEETHHDTDTQITDDTSLLKGSVQLSPNSVSTKWVSLSTASNISE